MRPSELRLITSRKERRSQLAARLGAVAERLRDARAPRTVLELLVSGVGRACGARHAAVHLVPRAGEAALTRARELGDCGGALPFDCAPALAATVETRRAHWYRNRAALIAAHPAFGRMDAAVTSVVALPLLDGDRLLGAFAVAYDDDHLLADDDLEFLLVAVDQAGRAFARAQAAAPVVANDQGTTICFRRISGGRCIQPRVRARVDVSRLVRLVARRQGGRGSSVPRVTCTADDRVVGAWDRRWLEGTLAGLFALARGLRPGAIHVELRADGDGAVVDLLCSAPAPARAEHVDLAELTSASEAWTLARWLWQGAALAEGARLTVLQDANAPCGLRIYLPSTRISLRR